VSKIMSAGLECESTEPRIQLRLVGGATIFRKLAASLRRWR
jgi:hypothetical protein